MEEGKYVHLFSKYAAVINILLKKSDNECQKLQLYKHEFEPTAQKKNINYTFSVNLINGKATKIVSTTTIAKDFWQMLDNSSTSRNLLKERKVKVSLDKSFELLFEKIEE